MIIVRLSGGLGNQMFQYSAGRALADKAGVELRLDVYTELEDPVIREHYKKLNQERSYMLDKFKINANIISKDALEQVMKERRNLWNLFRKKYVTLNEKELNSASILKSTYDYAYLVGNWQNVDYFAGIRIKLMKEFTLVEKPNTENVSLLKQIESVENSVAMHIRRGDYASNSTTNSVHGVCSPEYYYNALEYLKSEAGCLNLFVFSDDHEWVRNNLDLSDFNVVAVDINDSDNAHLDINLMKHCKHFIIANSTFSWWGAWLSDNKEKIVVAPKNWFATEALNSREKIVPENWVRL